MHTAPAPELHDDAQPARPRRATWSWRCPFCVPGTLAADRAGVLTCGACKATLPPPRAPESPWLSDTRTQDEHGPWQAYARHGGLAAEWGTSTDREDGAPPAKLDEPEEPTRVPRIRQNAVHGRQDRLLDGVIAGYAASTVALADTLRALRAKAIRDAHASTKAKSRHDEKIAAVLLAHLAAEATSQAATAAGPYLRARFAPGAYVLPPLYTRELDGTLTQSATDHRPPPTPPAPASDDAALAYWLSLATAWPHVYDGLIAAAVVLAGNLLIQRGVDASSTVGGEPGNGEPIALRLPRKERFAGTAHAVELAFSQPALAPRPSGPSAPGTHPIPGGIRFGEMAVAPTHASSGHAPGESAVIDHLDARAVLERLRPADQALLARDNGDVATKQDKARLRLARDRFAAALRAEATKGNPKEPEQRLIPSPRPRKPSPIEIRL